MEYYLKKTFCGMVLMVLKEWEDDGRVCGQYYKATEQEAIEFICSINRKELKETACIYPVKN